MPPESNPAGQPQQSSGEPSLHDTIVARLGRESDSITQPQTSAPEPVEQEEVTDQADNDEDIAQDEETEEEEQGQESQSDDEYDSDIGDESEDDEESSEGDDTEEEPDALPAAAVLDIDGRQVTADDYVAMENRLQEYDADYRRKTTVMSRIRQEYEGNGQQVKAVSSFFANMATQNVEQLEAMNVSQMSAQEFETYKANLAAAREGSQKLIGTMQSLAADVEKRIGAQNKHRAAESAEILKGIDSRWNTKFYHELRDFAVETGRYTPETFREVRDWQTLEGLIALRDLNEAKKGTQKATTTDNKTINKEKSPRKRRSRNRKQNRNTKGQFQTAKNAAMNSRAPVKDGSLREMFRARLDAEG